MCLRGDDLFEFVGAVLSDYIQALKYDRSGENLGSRL